MSNVTSKAFITITSIIFWFAAAGLIFIGAWVYKEYQHYDLIAESLYTLVPATILMAVGVFFFLLGIVGCVGACKEQKCLLGLFFTILLVILVGVVTAGVFGYIKRHDVDHQVQKGIHRGLAKYNYTNYTALSDQIDFMQKELKCCGLHNYTNWLEVDYDKVPDSCCVDNLCCRTTSNTTSNSTTHIPDNMRNNGTVGCYDQLKDQFLNHLGVVAGVAVGFAVVLIIGMAFSCVLICKRRSEVPYIGLSEPTGMRV